MSTSRVLGLMMVSALLAVGCSSPKKIDVGGACILNSDCNQPLVCTMSKCHDACHTSADCPRGESCVKTADGDICQLPAEGDCSKTLSCGGMFVCASDLQCRSGCQSAADCTSGQQCVGGVCADPKDIGSNGQLLPKGGDGGAGVGVGGTCVLNSDCDNSLVCTMGKCHDACHTLMDCPAGQSCVKTPNAVICQLPAEADCTRTVCNGAFVCASDLRCRTGCQSTVDCTSGQVCVSGVCADPIDLDVNGQLPQKGPSLASDGGADVRAPDAGSKDGGADLAVGPADAPSGTGADVAGTGTRADAPSGTGSDVAGTGTRGDAAPDLLADRSSTGAADLVARVDRPADLAADKLAGTGPDVNTSTPDAIIRPDGGGRSLVPTGCGVTPVSTRYFCDDFESGLGKWVVSGQDWDTTTTTARSGGNSITDSPNGNIVAAENAAITMATSLDLTSAVAPVLVFWDKRAASLNNTLVETSTDGGTTWSQLACWGDCGNYETNDHSTWLLEQISLATFVGKKVKIRFRLAQMYSYTGDGWSIDDVEIHELPAADTARAGAAGCSAMPAATTTRYFCDDFESGLSKWIVSGQDWNTTFSSAPSGTHSVTDSPDGKILAAEDAAITMATSVDLTGAVAPVLVFWDKRAASWDNNTAVEASTDGGTTWSQLACWGYCGNYETNDHSTWLLEQISLAKFVGKNVMIRFRLAQMDTDTGDGWYIDDVEIHELPAADTARAGAAGCSAMPAATTTRYFCDDFESGLSKWIVSGQDWDTTVLNARSGTHSVTDGPNGSILAGENAAITMALSADLTGAVSPVLAFWDKLAAGGTYVETSSDGGTTWSQLGQSADHSTWLLEQLSLAKFVGKNVMIRFRRAEAGNTTGAWYIDDVEISESN